MHYYIRFYLIEVKYCTLHLGLIVKSVIRGCQIKTGLNDQTSPYDQDNRCSLIITNESIFFKICLFKVIELNLK